MNTEIKTGIELIAEERREQIEKHGRTIAKDFEINKGRQLSEVAAALCHPMIPTPRKRLTLMPATWDDEMLLKMCKKSYKERLIIAGALIAAELDRIKIVGDRLSDDGI